MEDRRLGVSAEGRHVYDILITDSFSQLGKEMAKLDLENRRVCVVTETGVAPFYLDEVMKDLKENCAEVVSFVFKQGEDQKNLDTVQSLYEFLIQRAFDRKDLLVALGGGVTGDLTGFCAATYLRGIDFVQIPTSLLAQVDSSIGGKTGVDFAAYKNMVGAFYMPKLVYININTLKTLSARQYRSGIGEVIKHGLIRDRDYYVWIRDHREAITKRDPDAMAIMVEGSCRIKKEVVEEDPKEQGIRALLNFGHTFGHAIEKMMHFSLTHGECVAIGSQLAVKMSEKRGYLSREETLEILALYASFSYPGLPAELDPAQIVELTRHDKKMEHGQIKFILLNRIGQAAIYRDVTGEEMLSVLLDEESL